MSRCPTTARPWTPSSTWNQTMSWRTIRVTWWSRQQRCSMDSSMPDTSSPTEASLKWCVCERERKRDYVKMYICMLWYYGVSLTDWKIPRWWLWPLLSCFLWESNCSSDRYDPLVTPCLLHVELLSLLFPPSLSLSPPTPLLCLYRSLWCTWWIDGEALLPQVLWCVHSQVLPSPPHRWRLLWHGVSPHALHGAPGAPPIKTN